MQIANMLLLRTCLGFFVMSQGVSGGIDKVYYFAPVQKNRWNVRERGREQYEGG